MRTLGQKPQARTHVVAGRWWHELLVVAICVTATLVMTWPLARDFTTHICGEIGDPQSTLWAMRWMRDALVALQNPFFTPRVYHPQGATLVFYTFDIPSALVAVPLWGWLSETVIYNTTIFVAFALTAYGMTRLARELTGDALCGVLAGLVFAGVPYHYAHLRGHLHLVSMGWVPLYLVHLLRIVDDHGRDRDAVLAGVFLALASLASWYHLLFAAVISVPLGIAGEWRHRGRDGARRLVRRGAVLGLAWGVLAGPLLAAMIVTMAREPILGAHDALQYSADASSFFEPAALQLWVDGEQATYAGYTVVALALLGAWRDRRARWFLVVAVVGALLSLGPQLRWRDAPLGWRMPYAYLEFVPGLSFAGVPVRFGYVMYLGLVVAAAFGVLALRRAAPSASVGRGLVVAITALALWEYWPGPMPTSACPVPAPMRAWAADDRPWAVIDVSGCQMWHAVLHRKPKVGGHIGRRPKRLEDWILHQPILTAVMSPNGIIQTFRTEPRVDFTAGRPRDDAVIGGRLSAEWSGTLIAPSTGAYTFRLTAGANAVLEIDGQTIVRVFSGDGAPQDGRLNLKARAHALRLRVFDAPRDAAIVLQWASPGTELHVIPEEALRTAAGDPGLDAEYQLHLPAMSGLGREQGRAALRDLLIRYVVTGDVDNPCVERELELPLVHHGDGVRIYEVPPA